ncbi:MAG: Xaa-Pro peptidase family protein [Anaerolineales bacterium]|jgi:Xaa-Pro dipeptidase
MPIPETTFKKRQEKLANLLKETGLKGLALNPGSSLTYFTGLHFHLSERPVVGLFTPEQTPVLILPELEAAKLENLAYPLTPCTYPEDPDKWGGAFQAGAKSVGLKSGKVGVEDRCFRFLELELLKAAMPEVEFVNAVDTVARLRMVKDEFETAAMQEAVNVAQAALEAALPLVKIGMTEKELAAELVMQIFRQGSETTLPFQPIVATGPNSANPHAFPTDRPLAAGDLLVIDWGANIDGYFSDLTRTFAVGEANPEQEKIHKIVQEANAAGRAIARPGIPCGDVDEAAHQVIDKAGYGEYFTHRTGHGLGMEVHEEPYMRAGNPLLLEAGMTFTIEPGIYVPGKDGVRVEDDVVVTADGLHSFSDMERGLRIVG